MMEANKYISKKRKVKLGKTYEDLTYEVRELEISEADWNLIYDDVMGDNSEVAYDNGIYRDWDSGDYVHLDCQKVYDKMQDYLIDMKDNGESLDDFRDDYKERFERILKLLEDNLGFTIFYGEVENK